MTSEMRCPPVKRLIESVENDDVSDDLRRHFEGCNACSRVMDQLRDESDGLTFTIASLWMQERVSCPHENILLAHLKGSLDEEESAYVAFHLETVECPTCQARSAELEDVLAARTPRELEPAMERTLRSTITFLDRR